MPLNNPSAEVQINTGLYTGNSSVNRAIPHGLSKTPKAVFIVNQNDGAPMFWLIRAFAGIFYVAAAAAGKHAVTAADATNFYVGNAASYTNSGNLATKEHEWVAIS